MEALKLILLVLGLFCFVLEVLSIRVPRVNFLALGLSFWILTFILSYF